MHRPLNESAHHPELERLRARIDEIDAGLIDLIATRVEVSKEAVGVVSAAGLPLEDLAREAAEVRRASALARTRGVEPEVVRDVFWRLIGLSRWAASRNGQSPRVPVPDWSGDSR
jgi:chorismate mutase